MVLVVGQRCINWNSRSVCSTVPRQSPYPCSITVTAVWWHVYTITTCCEVVRKRLWSSLLASVTLNKIVGACAARWPIKVSNFVRSRSLQYCCLELSEEYECNLFGLNIQRESFYSGKTLPRVDNTSHGSQWSLFDI